MSYNYLHQEPSPKILVQALSLLGTKEVVGSLHSKVILGWAKELGLQNVYTNDEIAWCGLFVCYCATKGGLDINMTNEQSLWALNWNKFGTKQTTAMLGDVLTFKRKSGGHVGIYVGEDDTCYHVLGGNQSNMVCITRIEKTRLSQIRRTKWRVSQPENVRVIKLTSDGIVSENEA